MLYLSGEGAVSFVGWACEDNTSGKTAQEIVGNGNPEFRMWMENKEYEELEMVMVTDGNGEGRQRPQRSVCRASEVSS